MSVQRRDAPPILRWAGGKRWLLRHIEVLCKVWSPSAFYEPFAGGAAVFLGFSWPNATINDINADLMATYRALAHEPAKVEAGLSSLRVSREQYDELRQCFPADDVQRAVRLLYLNRCGYGGIYRINKDGTYNVPFSGDRNIASLWSNNRLMRMSVALNDTTLAVGDFEQSLTAVSAGAFVYCDPVYVLPEASGLFTRYSYPQFMWHDLERLATIAHELRARGALVAVSGSADTRVARLFRGALAIKFSRRAPLPKARGGRFTEALYVLGDPKTQAAISREVEQL
jgi:DNA adenine methylase